MVVVEGKYGAVANEDTDPVDDKAVELLVEDLGTTMPRKKARKGVLYSRKMKFMGSLAAVMVFFAVSAIVGLNYHSAKLRRAKVAATHLAASAPPASGDEDKAVQDAGHSYRHRLQRKQKMMPVDEEEDEIDDRYVTYEVDEDDEDLPPPPPPSNTSGAAGPTPPPPPPPPSSSKKHLRHHAVLVASEDDEDLPPPPPSNKSGGPPPPPPPPSKRRYRQAVLAASEDDDELPPPPPSNKSSPTGPPPPPPPSKKRFIGSRAHKSSSPPKRYYEEDDDDKGWTPPPPYRKHLSHSHHSVPQRKHYRQSAGPMDEVDEMGYDMEEAGYAPRHKKHLATTSRSMRKSRHYMSSSHVPEEFDAVDCPHMKMMKQMRKHLRAQYEEDDANEITTPILNPKRKYYYYYDDEAEDMEAGQIPPHSQQRKMKRLVSKSSGAGHPVARRKYLMEQEEAMVPMEYEEVEDVDRRPDRRHHFARHH